MIPEFHENSTLMYPTLMTEQFEVNQLLAQLPLAEKQELKRHLEPVKWRTRQELNHVGGALRHLYFPT
jgi:hypothetical protein